MLFDWLAREGWIVLSWWLLVTLAGAAVLPLCLRLLGGLPDRGYTLARAAGLLLVGFTFWLLASLGFLRNTTDSMALAWLIVLLAGTAVYLRRGRERVDLRVWWRENSRVVIAAEIIFFVLFFGWSLYRAHQNGLSGTEKPMELAFLSATMRSETFPPADPWLSGYAISYYYFGYVIMAMLSKLSGVASTVGFNAANALLFALTGVTVFGVVYNLVRSGAFNRFTALLPSRRAAMLTGVLGMVLVVLLGNFQLLLIELPYQTGTASEAYLRFWNTNERQTPLTGTPTDDFTQWGDWWWFRAARVLNDFDLSGARAEVIDEFPQFSFLLADNHPHVLALPFAVLALGLALNTLLYKRRPSTAQIIFYSLVFGGLIFLNTWDGPIYLIVLVAAEALRRLMLRGRLTTDDWRSLALLGIVLIVLASVFYLPFIAAFRSQLAGILPNLQSPTLFQQYFAHFGPLLLLFVPFLIVETWRAGASMNWRRGLQIGILLFFGLFVLMLLLTVLAALIPAARDSVLSFVEMNGGWGSVIPALVAKRITHILTSLVLTVLLVVVAARLFSRRESADTGDDPQGAMTYSPQTGFALLLIAAALVLTLVPEFVYLRDNFSTRMNTVFKFYYQAWLMFAIGGAYGVYSVFAGLRLPSVSVRAAYAVLTAAVLLVGLLYPVMGVIHRATVEGGRLYAPDTPLTLDGIYTLTSADDTNAALCLGNRVQSDGAVIVSAVGGSYGWTYGTVSTFTGIPTVLNWAGHQSQWRGSTYGETVGNRQQDIDTIYANPTWEATRQIIEKYGIDYVFFGMNERNQYGATSEIKFMDYLDVVCEYGDTRVYAVPERAFVAAQ